MDFLKEFTSITEEEMYAARKLKRPNPCIPIIRKDGEGKPVLESFIAILREGENSAEEEMKAWIKSVKI